MLFVLLICTRGRDIEPGLLTSHPHYANMPMSYTALFYGCKNDNFQIKTCDDIFVIFPQNIDCEYTLEPPLSGGFNEYPQSMF